MDVGDYDRVLEYLNWQLRVLPDIYHVNVKLHQYNIQAKGIRNTTFALYCWRLDIIPPECDDVNLVQLYFASMPISAMVSAKCYCIF